MGRKSFDTKVTENHIDKKRKDAIEKFFGLTEKVLKHIEWSITATKVCVNCSVNPTTGEIIPGKAKDAEGKCAFCHGSSLVPDTVQRNWATGEIADRIAPKPKAVEMTVDQTSHVAELEDEMKRLSPDELKRQVEVLDMQTVKQIVANGG